MATKLGTTNIDYAPTENVLHAVRYANDNGRPLNLIATIDLAGLGFTNDNAGSVFRNVWCNVSRWWRYQRQKGQNIGSFDGVATHENPADKRNVHWLIHAPEEFRPLIETAIAKRLKKITKLDCLGDTLHFQKADTPGTFAKYMLKGINPAFAKLFYIEPSDQGVIIGRRVTVSRSLGRSARKRQQWKRKRRPRNY
jgi:hypothetical protein